VFLISSLHAYAGFHGTIVVALLMALAGGLASALLVHRLVRVPVRHFMSATERIAAGDLETRVDVGTKSEIGQLAAAFNRMTDELRRAKQGDTERSQSLERKIVDKTEELSRAQRQMTHMEKMASLGKLAAAVAHELNNPLSAILMYSRLVARELEGSAFPPGKREELDRYLSQVESDARRCGKVLRNLLLFARPSGRDFALHHLNQIIERSLVLVRHHLEMARIQLENHPLDGDDAISCDADQLQQAFVALLVNAVEAMPGGGLLTVRATQADGSIRIDVSDTGVSIGEEMLSHVFEPFVSTKDEQSGVGLGLPVVYSIVQRHGGNIEVESAAGRGTSFRVFLPKRKSGTAPTKS